MYLLLAFDTWALMIEHGGRYGIGQFNVAHFAWLERLFPNPSSALYVGLVASCGLLSLGAALGTVSLAGRAILAFLYTLAWAISLHDSYQHHYLLSWLLFFLLWMPRLSVRWCAWTRHLIPTLGVPLVASSCATVYAFTLVSKLSPLWWNGQVLHALSRPSGPLAWGSHWLMARGASEQAAFHAFAVAVVLLQAAAALGFVASVVRDTARSRGPAVLCSLGLLASMSFHLLTELDAAFSIGWFSYYMGWLALVLLAPWRWLQSPLRPLAWVSRRLRLETSPSWPLVFGVLTLALALAAFTGVEADLPGVAAASWAVVLGGCAQTLHDLVRSRRRAALRSALSLSASFTAVLVLLGTGNLRFDYYRRTAGELLRMGQDAQALSFYRRAERYAPVGQSRQNRIRSIERRLSEKRSQ